MSAPEDATLSGQGAGRPADQCVPPSSGGAPQGGDLVEAPPPPSSRLREGLRDESVAPLSGTSGGRGVTAGSADGGGAPAPMTDPQAPSATRASASATERSTVSGDRARLEELRAEALWRWYARDEVAFLEREWSIATPSTGRQLFTLRDAQRYALNHFNTHRYSLTLKARQIGWSTLVAAHAFHSAFFGEAREIIFLSRGEREATQLMTKVKYGYKHLPQWLLDKGPKIRADHQQRMLFDNGSRIVSMPSASDPARGSTAWLVVVDEWAFLPNAEEAWASIEPVADIGGRIIGLSTANGSGNFFHQLWVDAETGNNNFATMFFPWSANEDRDADWYEAKRSSMSDWQLWQEYPTNSDEAFVRSGRPYFDLSTIQRRSAEVKQPKLGHLVDVPT